MKINWRIFLNKKQSSHSRKMDLVAVLEEAENRGKDRLKVAIPCEAAKKLEHFLKEKGFTQKNGIPLLVDYGLSDQSEEELEKLKMERETQVGKLYSMYCKMKFYSYNYFRENKAIAMSLTLLLHENRSLKTRMKNEDLQDLVPKDEWDDWDESVIDNYYRKYVFINRL